MRPRLAATSGPLKDHAVFLGLPGNLKEKTGPKGFLDRLELHMD